MSQGNAPERLFIIDIDGLRQDVFHQALEQGMIPNLSGLLGGTNAAWGIHLDPCSTAPSITFCAQSSIFTGQIPGNHGIVGNQFFDRFGSRNGGTPRFYAFDIGDALAYQDAVLTFVGESGLVGRTLNADAPTLYERSSANACDSVVAYHMVSRGASRWLPPDIVDIARFTRGGGLLGLSAEQYDGEMVDRLMREISSGYAPTVLTAYFMGLDHQSHEHGPTVQLNYLTTVVDRLVGRLVEGLNENGMLANLLVLVVSDHGQIEVIPDDRHSLRLSFPFDREMGYLFDALGLDVHDVPGEGPNCDALVASNGGMAHVYLQNRAGKWHDAPRFDRDVLPVARAFWEAHQTGRYAADLQNALALVLVRNVERDGWQADYQALTPEGKLVSIEEYLREHPEIKTVDAAPRIHALEGPNSGDILLVSNYDEKFYFGGPTTGVHGGLHPEDSLCVASLGWLGVSEQETIWLRETARAVIDENRRASGREHASLADVMPIITRLFGWQ